MYWCSLATISLISVYILILSVIPLLYKDSGIAYKGATIATISSSMGILVISIFESSKNYLLRAERFLMCARELGDLVRRLDMIIDTKSGSIDDVEAVSSSYSKILNKYNENHENYDHNFFKSERPDEFNIRTTRRCFYMFRWYSVIYSRYFILSAIPPIVTILFIF